MYRFSQRRGYRNDGHACSPSTCSCMVYVSLPKLLTAIQEYIPPSLRRAPNKVSSWLSLSSSIRPGCVTTATSSLVQVTPGRGIPLRRQKRVMSLPTNPWIRGFLHPPPSTVAGSAGGHPSLHHTLTHTPHSTHPHSTPLTPHPTLQHLTPHPTLHTPTPHSTPLTQHPSHLTLQHLTLHPLYINMIMHSTRPPHTPYQRQPEGRPECQSRNGSRPSTGRVRCRS